MARNITVTFADGSQHVYQNAPDDITPQAAAQRAQQDFGKPVQALDGGNSAQPQGPAAEGAGATFDRGLANSATAGWGDKLRAAAETFVPASVLNTVQHYMPGVGPLLPDSAQGTQTVWQNGSWAHPINSIENAYTANRAAEQAQTTSDAVTHPVANIAGNVAGGFALPFAGEVGLAGRLARQPLMVPPTGLGSRKPQAMLDRPMTR